MKLRIACKIISRSWMLDQSPYKDPTLDEAVRLLWRSVGRRGRWHAPDCRRKCGARIVVKVRHNPAQSRPQDAL